MVHQRGKSLSYRVFNLPCYKPSLAEFMLATPTGEELNTVVLMGW
jgi:hypothetical protein